VLSLGLPEKRKLKDYVTLKMDYMVVTYIDLLFVIYFVKFYFFQPTTLSWGRPKFKVWLVHMVY